MQSRQIPKLSGPLRRRLYVLMQSAALLHPCVKGVRRVPRKKRLPGRDDVIRQLAAMAFGKANDCVLLALDQGEARLEELDLSLLAGVKRNKDGSVEVKLVDRMQALRQLAELTEEDLQQESLLEQLRRGAEG